MKTPAFNCFAFIVLFATDGTTGNVSSPVPEYSVAATPVPVQVIQSTTNLIEQRAHIFPESTVPTQGLTPEPENSTDLPISDVSPVPQGTGTSQLPQIQSADSDISDVHEETNNINEIIIEDDIFLNYNQKNISPEDEKIIQDVPSLIPTISVINEPKSTLYDETEIDLIVDQTESADIYKDFTSTCEQMGFKPWKIGLISAAVFLIIEVVVLTAYCYVCKKKRRAIITNNCEQDSEAGETINVESNDNTVNGEDGTLNCCSLPHAVDYQHPVAQKGEEKKNSEMKDIIMDKRSTDV
ncbi:Hypothetical predicted protein [Pelobates cultripes]|uniref:Uncharacterized protein n=1 Tax=Pelobates cultripes TaxID=61616 RepID=A0AAD1S907_PELCU|nr:Hypothetical predicted protein [Pelobates cultripes]